MGKSCETCLTNRTRPVSHYITQLVSYALEGGHTDTQTHIPTYEPKQFQETRCAQPSAARGFFKKVVGITINVRKQVASYVVIWIPLYKQH